MSAIAQSAERTPSGLLRIRLAIVRAIVEQMEHSLNEFDQTVESSIGQQRAEELASLARAFRRPLGAREDHVLTFAGFRLDLNEGRLCKDDHEVRLRPKPYAVLCYLVKHPHRLVTKSELVEAVWGKIAMSDSLVRTHVGALRHVLGHRLIETVVGRGYRFIADVDRCDRALSSLAVETPSGGVEHEPLLDSVGRVLGLLADEGASRS
jgi:DNA-binding winged helix-turn-helix (wHTH) protein